MLISGRGKLYASPGEGTIANRDTSQDLFVPLGGRLGEVPEQRFGLVHGVAEAGARLRLPLLAGLVEVVSHAAAAHAQFARRLAGVSAAPAPDPHDLLADISVGGLGAPWWPARLLWTGNGHGAALASDRPASVERSRPLVKGSTARSGRGGHGSGHQAAV